MPLCCVTSAGLSFPLKKILMVEGSSASICSSKVWSGRPRHVGVSSMYRHHSSSACGNASCDVFAAAVVVDAAAVLAVVAAAIFVAVVSVVLFVVKMVGGCVRVLVALALALATGAESSTEAQLDSAVMVL